MSGVPVRYHLDPIEPPRNGPIAPEVAPGTCLCPSCRAKSRGSSRIRLVEPGRPYRGWRLH